MSTEQEKAFYKVDPVTSFSCFGFCPGFTAKVPVLYSNSVIVLWRSERVVRQVCPLSAMLDSDDKVSSPQLLNPLGVIGKVHKGRVPLDELPDGSIWINHCNVIQGRKERKYSGAILALML